MNLLSKILNEPSLGAWFETKAGEEGLGFCASRLKMGPWTICSAPPSSPAIS
jgi:hypothetical protein